MESKHSQTNGMPLANEVGVTNADGLFRGIKARSPQYVLGTKNGDIRTSNVTEEKILDAIDDIEDNGCVYLEKCVLRWCWSAMQRHTQLITLRIAV